MWKRPTGLKSAFTRFSRVATFKRSLTKSSVQGPLEPPLSYKTLPQYFTEDVLSKHSSRPALICRNEDPRAHGGPLSANLGVSTHLAWDYEEFDRHIMALARGLLGMGVQKGDRVGVIMGNNRYVNPCPSWIMLTLYCTVPTQCFNGHALVSVQF